MGNKQTHADNTENLRRSSCARSPAAPCGLSPELNRKQASWAGSWWEVFSLLFPEAFKEAWKAGWLEFELKVEGRDSKGIIARQLLRGELGRPSPHLQGSAGFDECWSRYKGYEFQPSPLSLLTVIMNNIKHKWSSSVTICAPVVRHWPPRYFPQMAPHICSWTELGAAVPRLSPLSCSASPAQLSTSISARPLGGSLQPAGSTLSALTGLTLCAPWLSVPGPRVWPGSGEKRLSSQSCC